MIKDCLGWFKMILVDWFVWKLGFCSESPLLELLAHINKKKPCKKCDINFITQYAYVNNECININNYNKVLNKIPKCKNGHELVLCKGKYI